MELTTRLEHLLLTKPFEHLTSKEKQYVLSQISGDEFERYQQFLQATEKTLTSYRGQPKPSIKKNVLEHIRQNKKGSSIAFSEILAALFAYRIPAWQAALSLVLLMIAFLWNSQSGEMKAIEPTTPYVQAGDSLYKEIVKTVSEIADTSGKTLSIRPLSHSIPQKATIPGLGNKKISIQSVPTIYPKDLTASDTSSNPIIAHQKLKAAAEPSNLFHFNKSPKGRSAKEDSALMKFIVEIY